MKWLYTIVLGLWLSLSALAAEPVDVNTADAQTIADNLNGVGLSKAHAIVAYREAHGTFKHVDELVNVKGIGLKLIDKNRGFILLVQPETESS
jgi:competence protein ComEA